MKYDDIIARQTRVVYILMGFTAAGGFVWALWEHLRHAAQ
ncbi:hypothetical protein HNP98_003171 [Hymenobacter sp. 9A]|uniref:Uncharacterized protein n=1 Tax=Hymenobacter caeli TaxID=2735894 RepID=A0ABX2FV95_9BACT|nr:hypothetical protein [Hymenobacter caeli]